MGTRTKANKELGDNVPLRQIQPPSFSRKGKRKEALGEDKDTGIKITVSSEKLC
jgi:hypothetical protein